MLGGPMRTVYYAATSLDGFIADVEGGVGWLERYNASELGYEAFLAKVGAVVLGRATYEQSLTFGPWPYEGRRGLIVTSRPIDGLPEGVRAVTTGELPAALADLRAQTTGEVWIVGGGKTARACVEAGLVDELELYVVPRLLGRGIPLLGERGVESMKLLETRAFENGVVMLRYALR
jgi:dihydrofolate reductase